MRILYLGDTGSPHFRAWPLHFLQLGHDVHVSHVSTTKPERFDGPRWESPARWVGTARRGIWRLSALEVLRVSRRVQPDVVHTHQLRPAAYLAALARLSPHVATAWGSEVLLAAHEREHGEIRRVACAADLLTADSHHLLETLHQHGAPRMRLRFIPWGIDFQWLALGLSLSREDAAAAVGLPLGRKIVLSHRGTRRIFRPDVVIRALAAVRAKTDRALAVVVVDDTGDAWPREELRSLARSVGVDDSVVLLDRLPHERMPMLYRSSSVCVSLASSDSAPTSVFEALALRVPAVVSDLPWVREPTYRHARLRVVDGGDDAAVASAIVGALEEVDESELDYNARYVERHLDRRQTFGQIGLEYERLARDCAA